MPRLEEITYEAGRHALADQEAFVAGIRQRAGTLLAAHALVASFLGATALRESGLTPTAAVALVTLLLGLTLAATLLAPWRIAFAISAREIYRENRHVFEQAPDSQTWLVGVGVMYEQLRINNIRMVRWMMHLSTALAVLVVAHAVLWIVILIGVT